MLYVDIPSSTDFPCDEIDDNSQICIYGRGHDRDGDIAYQSHTSALNHAPQTLNILNNKRSYLADTQHSNNIICHYIDINNYFNYIMYVYLFIYNANLLGTGLSMLGFKMGSVQFRNGKLPILNLTILKPFS